MYIVDNFSFESIFERIVFIIFGVMAECVKRKGLCQIQVRMLGENRIVFVAPESTVLQLKQHLVEDSDVDYKDLRVIFAGSVLPDSMSLQQCDLGQQSTIHVILSIDKNKQENDIKVKSSSVALLGPTMDGIKQSGDKKRQRFYVYCKSTCHGVQPGKLRVRCSGCKDAAFLISRTTSKGPDSWSDVLERNKIKGQCINKECEGIYAEFFFKCAFHQPFGDDRDEAIPLCHLTSNTRDVPCLACLEILDIVLLFPCVERHAMCIPCFSIYCQTKIRDRQLTLVQSPKEIGYTLPCPGGSENCNSSYIEEIHHFRLAGDEQYERYQRFATEDLVLQSGGILCPGRGCGSGIFVEERVRRIVCDKNTGGCGLTFCRNCLDRYHPGSCNKQKTEPSHVQQNYEVIVENARQARWQKEASLQKIRETTKSCPGCRSPTEKAGGCNHMTCQRCQFQWCWNCEIEWNNNCQADHWFRIL